MTRRITEGELLSIINEENELLNEVETYHSAILSESLRLEREGYSKDQINEGVVGMLASIIGHAPSGLVDMFKAKLIRHVQSGLGFNPESFLGRVVGNVIEAIKLSELPQYFGPNKCGRLADMVIDGIAETLMEAPGDRIAASFGFNPNSALWMTFRESITNAIMDESGIGGTLKNKIKEYVCNLSFSEMLSGAREKAGEAGRGIMGMFGGGAGASGGGGSSAASDAASRVVVPTYAR
jgi:uncharacterized membrane protein YgcG